jgi:hypothetical protein
MKKDKKRTKKKAYPTKEALNPRLGSDLLSGSCGRLKAPGRTGANQARRMHARMEFL